MAAVLIAPAVVADGLNPPPCGRFTDHTTYQVWDTRASATAPDCPPETAFTVLGWRLVHLGRQRGGRGWRLCRTPGHDPRFRQWRVGDLLRHLAGELLRSAYCRSDHCRHTLHPRAGDAEPARPWGAGAGSSVALAFAVVISSTRGRPGLAGLLCAPPTPRRVLTGGCRGPWRKLRPARRVDRLESRLHISPVGRPVSQCAGDYVRQGSVGLSGGVSPSQRNRAIKGK